MFGCVRERKMRSRCAKRIENLFCAAANFQTRRAVFIADDFNILPADSAAPACSQSLERGFFGGKARCVMLRRDDAFAVAVSALLFGKNTHDKTRRALDCLPDAINFNYVNSD